MNRRSHDLTAIPNRNRTNCRAPVACVFCPNCRKMIPKNRLNLATIRRTNCLMRNRRSIYRCPYRICRLPLRSIPHWKDYVND